MYYKVRELAINMCDSKCLTAQFGGKQRDTTQELSYTLEVSKMHGQGKQVWWPNAYLGRYRLQVMSGETKKTLVQNFKASQIPYKFLKPLVPAPAGFHGCRRCSPSLKRSRSTAWPCFKYKHTRLLLGLSSSGMLFN